MQTWLKKLNILITISITVKLIFLPWRYSRVVYQTFQIKFLLSGRESNNIVPLKIKEAAVVFPGPSRTTQAKSSALGKPAKVPESTSSIVPEVSVATISASTQAAGDHQTYSQTISRASLRETSKTFNKKGNFQPKSLTTKANKI